MATLANRTQMKGVFVNVPAVDWSLFRELARKFGWQTETREQLLDRFASSRPSATPKEQALDKVDHALGQLSQIKDGEIEGIPAEDLLNEL